MLTATTHHYHQVSIKEETDLGEDALMTTPSPAPNEPDYNRQRSNSLPYFSHGVDQFSHDTQNSYDDYDYEYGDHNLEQPGAAEVHDDDQMSIQQETHPRVNRDNQGRRREDSVSTVITIRNYPMSPISDLRTPGMDEGDFDLVRTAEYQRAVYEMLEDWCMDAARKYWQDVASQRRYCIPTSRAHSRMQSRNSRFRSNPYPPRRGAYALPLRYPIRFSRPYDPYNFPPSPRDEDTRMSLSPPRSLTEDVRSHQPLRFLELISKITKHIWRTERVDPVAPHRAEYLTARKVWDVWRLAEVVASTTDEVDGYDEMGVRCRDEVVGIVHAAGELCDILGDRVGCDRCEELVLSWVLDEVEEGEIVE